MIKLTILMEHWNTLSPYLNIRTDTSVNVHKGNHRILIIYALGQRTRAWELPSGTWILPM